MKSTTFAKFLQCLLLGTLTVAEVGLTTAQPSLPPGARLRLGTLDFRHTGEVKGVGFLPDRKTLVSVGGGDIFLWDLKTGKERNRYAQGPLLAISPDGKTLAMGWEAISLVDAATGKLLRRLRDGLATFTCAGFNADGTTLITGSEDQAIRLWETESGKLIRSLKTSHQYGPKTVTLSPDGNTCFSLGGHPNRTLQLWDTATGKPIFQFPGVGIAVFSRDSRAVIASHGGDLIFLEVATGKEQKRLQGRYKDVYRMAVAPDGKAIAFGYEDSFGVLDLTKGEQGQWVSWPRACMRVSSLAFSADGKTLAIGGFTNTVHLWDWRAGQEHFANGHQGTVFKLAFSPENKTLLSLGTDYTLRLWSLPGGKQIRLWGGYQNDRTPINFMLRCPDGTSAFLGGWGGYLRRLDLNTGKERPFDQSKTPNIPAAITTDGQNLITFTPIQTNHAEVLTCTLWDTTRSEKVRHFVPSVPKHPQVQGSAYIAAVAFSPDGKTFASAWVSYRHGFQLRGPVDRGICLWNIATGKERPIATQATTLVFLDQGKTLVTVYGDDTRGVMQFWDVATLKQLRQLEGPREWGGILAFSADGKWFASTGGINDPTVYLWQTATGKQIKRFVGHRSEVYCLAFSSDGRMLASGSNDTTILLWELLGLQIGGIGQMKDRAGSSPLKNSKGSHS